MHHGDWCRMHVAVDAHNLVADNRGIGRYARAVLSRAMREPDTEWTLVVRRFFPDRRALTAAVAGAPFHVAQRVPRGADIVWFPWNGTFLETQVRSVATIHDCTPFAYPVVNSRRRATEQGPFKRTASTASRILVQSTYTASEVQRWLGVERRRMTVTPLAADALFAPGPADALPAELRGRRFVLCVGTHEERKNTPTLAAAFERAFAPGVMTLVFTRSPDRLPRDARVVAANDDVTLAAMYRAATLVAVPSLSEGFGLPLLEAMASGAPCVAAYTSALPEVGGNAVAWVHAPRDAEMWSRALRALAADDPERARLAAAGPVRAATFSWDRCTAQTLAVLRSVARE